MKKTPTRVPNVFSYDTKKGKRYRVVIMIKGVAIDKSGFKTLNDAKEFLRTADDYAADIRNGVSVKKEYTFEQYYQLYKENSIFMGKWSTVTIRNKDSHFKILSPFFEKRNISSITRIEIQKIADNMIRSGLRTRTVSGHISFLKSMFDHAVKNEILSKNSASSVEIAKSEKGIIKKEISKETYSKALEYFKTKETIQMYVFFLLCSLGLRKGEAIAIKTSKIQFNDDYTVKITIDDSVTFAERNGQGRTKTGRSRFIYGDKALFDSLKQCIKSSEEILISKKRRYDPNDFHVIINERGSVYHINAINLRFKKVNEVLDENLTPHMLRHFFATQAQSQNINPRLISDFLGHKQTTMTDHYSHQTDDGTKLVLQNTIDLLR